MTGVDSILDTQMRSQRESLVTAVVAVLNTLEDDVSKSLREPWPTGKRIRTDIAIESSKLTFGFVDMEGCDVLCSCVKLHRLQDSAT